MKAAEVAAALKARKLDVLRHLLPGGRLQGHEYYAGSLRGEAGKSLKVNINGKGCVWSDFATGEKGADLLDLWAQTRCRGSVSDAMREAADWLGIRGSSTTEPKPKGEPPPHPKLGAPAMLFGYYTATGAIIGHVGRWNLTTTKKTFRPCTWCNGRWDWFAGFAKPRPLYRLPDLAANPDAPVLLVEGEKAADAAVHIVGGGYVAACWSGGADGVEHADLLPLKGRDVVLWPDADEPGRKAMATAGRLLVPIARSVRLVDLPADAPEGWDVADPMPAIWGDDTIDRLISEARPVEAEAADEDGLEEWDAGADDYQIPPREWLLGAVFCRTFLSSLIGDGGIGKTALRYTQLLSLAIGRSLTGEHVFLRCRVLIVSLEDDDKELRRRIRAAMLHHGVEPATVKGWLYLAAIGGKGWKVATLDDNGVVVPAQLAERLERTIARRSIDVVSIDPFVKSHAVEENANSQIDAVASILTGLAHKHNCAVDAPHHVSKGTTDPGNANRGRGASAFKDAGRLVYTLSAMTPEEAESFGLSDQDRRRLIRMDSGKVNIAPPAVEAKWFRLVGVPLGNGTDLYPKGDEVQAVEPWQPPATFQGLSHATLNLILDRIAAGMPNGERYSAAGAAGERAVWQVFSELTDRTEKQARAIVKTWLKSGLLYHETYKSPRHRKNRQGLRVNDAKRPS